MERLEILKNIHTPEILIICQKDLLVFSQQLIAHDLFGNDDCLANLQTSEYYTETKSDCGYELRHD